MCTTAAVVATMASPCTTPKFVPNSYENEPVKLIDFNHNNNNTPEVHNSAYRNLNNAVWLSKPRQRVLFQTGSPAVNRAKPNNDLSTPTKTPSDHSRFDMNSDSILKLGTLKLALHYFGIVPSPEQWETTCTLLQINDSGYVQFGDFVQAIKQVFSKELQFIGMTSNQLFDTVVNLNGYYSQNQQKSPVLTDLNNKIKQLQEEKTMAQKEIERLQRELDEKTRNLQTAEKENLFIQTELQEISKINHELRKQVESSPKIKKLFTRSKCSIKTQTENIPMPDSEKHLSALTKRYHKAEFNYHLYKIATEKLLQFTQVVHDNLTKIRVQCIAVKLIKHGEHSKKPPQLNRESDVEQARNGDVNNCVVKKSRSGARVSRATSLCAINHMNKEVELELSDRKRDLLLERLIDKSKELVDTFTEILADSNANETPVQFRAELTLTKDSVQKSETKIENDTRITYNPNKQTSSKQVVWV